MSHVNSTLSLISTLIGFKKADEPCNMFNKVKYKY